MLKILSKYAKIIGFPSERLVIFLNNSITICAFKLNIGINPKIHKSRNKASNL